MKVAREREKKDDFAEIHLCIYLFARMCVKVFVKVTDERRIWIIDLLLNFFGLILNDSLFLSLTKK